MFLPFNTKTFTLIGRCVSELTFNAASVKRAQPENSCIQLQLNRTHKIVDAFLAHSAAMSSKLEARHKAQTLVAQKTKDYRK